MAASSECGTPKDAPEPDQIEKVVMRFHQAPENVVCLQGILDYYNSRSNWMARCFTIEYATWWRLVMPGMARLGAGGATGRHNFVFQTRRIGKNWAAGTPTT